VSASSSSLQPSVPPRVATDATCSNLFGCPSYHQKPIKAIPTFKEGQQPKASTFIHQR